MANTVASITVNCPVCTQPFTLTGGAGTVTTEGLNLSFDATPLVGHVREQHPDASVVQPDTDDPIEIRPWLVIKRYRPDAGGHAWCMRCWGHDGCDGHLDLDLSSRQYAEHKARRHLAEHHPEEA